MKTLLVIFVVLVAVSPLYSQPMFMYPEGGSLTGGLGFTQIDNEKYFSFSLRPDLSIGKFGVGLNISLLYNADNGHIRSEDWNESYDWARLIRYIRYGRKGDNFFTRVGAQDLARLGHGFIMNYYTNEASYDDRKIGLALDYDFGIGGFETLTSNLGRAEILGGRGFVRPLRPFIPLPIIKDIAVGLSYVMDIDPDGRRGTSDATRVVGFDVEVPLLRFSMFNSYAYFDAAHIQNRGSGRAVGVQAHLTLIAGVAEASAQLERRWLGKEFTPSYFNAFYEVERYYPVNDTTFSGKYDALLGITDETRGVFGEVVGDLMNIVRFIGNFQRLDDQKNSGVLHIAAEIPDAVPKIAAHATYDRRAIEKMSDLFKLDDDSVARVGIGYKIMPYMLLYLDYIYTFRFDELKNRYMSQERFEPRLALTYNFNM